MRGVTQEINFTRLHGVISTHTPHARRDRYQFRTFLANPISTHTPHARRDTISEKLDYRNIIISTHTPHARRDAGGQIRGSREEYFNSHASCEA